jgi:hypothetical protein
MRDVEEIDLDGQIVTVSPGFRPRQPQLKYTSSSPSAT